ncbi:aldolase/citrate lyase family protein [Candidatus Pseudothioglobus singularis]|nr:aldolase/citrate lyase family protein [Candidatus Pseudothioglobus singularis]
MNIQKYVLNLAKKLKNNNLTIGAWITIYNPSIAEIFANAGFDWVVIDLEHSSINLSEAENLIRVVELSGATPLVRLTSNDSDQIKRVMDAGSHGVIVPMVKTLKDVQNAINSVKYPPVGVRGVGLARAQRWGNEFDNYLKWLENDSIIIVQIEHIEAVDNLDEIFSSDGVNGYIIGPYDLSSSMNMPGDFTNPDFIKVIEKIRNKAHEHNLCGGIHIVEPNIEELHERISEGYKFIAYSLDTRILDSASRNALSSLNQK